MKKNSNILNEKSRHKVKCLATAVIIILIIKDRRISSNSKRAQMSYEKITHYSPAAVTIDILQNKKKDVMAGCT